MNKVNDYETLLELANKDLKQYNTELHVYDPGESGEYTIEIRTLNENGSVACYEDYAEGYYEEELSDLIDEAWAHAKKSAIQIKRALKIRAKEEIKKKYSLSDEAHLIAESIQEITLNAWPIIYGPHNEYDQDSRDVLMTIREWGVEFEQWWMSHDEDWRDTHDYLEEIWDFTDKKCKEYLKELGVETETEPEQKKWIVRITRVEKYEGDVLVTAASQKEAEEKVADAWQDDEYQWLYEDMTECVNCDSQTYEATPATDGAHWDFDLTSYKPRG